MDGYIHDYTRSSLGGLTEKLDGIDGNAILWKIATMFPSDEFKQKFEDYKKNNPAIETLSDFVLTADFESFMSDDFANPDEYIDDDAYDDADIWCNFKFGAEALDGGPIETSIGLYVPNIEDAETLYDTICDATRNAADTGVEMNVSGKRLNEQVIIIFNNEVQITRRYPAIIDYKERLSKEPEKSNRLKNILHALMHNQRICTDCQVDPLTTYLNMQLGNIKFEN